MKLIFAATHVSLILQLAHCACLVYVIGKAQYNNGGLPRNGLTSQTLPWNENNCCHLPENEQDCSCCLDACIRQRRRRLLPRNCCYLPKRFISCRCCPAACLPPPVLPPPSYLALTPQPLPSLQELSELSPLPQLSEPQLPFSCCHLPLPFQNCQCCPSACPLPPPVPLNESCCHWPKSLQNCICCVSSCSSTTTVVDEPVTEHAADNCCSRVKPKPNCSCCAEGCDKGTKLEETTEASMETTQIISTKVPKAPNNCCHFPTDLQNCNCCPSLCQETTISTEQTTTSSLVNCCNQPEELQSCGCCSKACKRDDGNEISPSTVITITMTTSATVPIAEKMGRCCHLSGKFKTCECCPENCGATADLLQYGTCCHWPKLLQRCDCCRDACLYLTSSPQSTDLMEDCCDDPLELQDCECCPTSPYCSQTISQRKMLQDLPYWYSEIPSSDFLPYIDLYKHNTLIAPRYKQREFEHRPETYFVHAPAHTKSSTNDYNSRRSLVPIEVFGYPYTKRRKYTEEYEHDDYNTKPPRRNPTVYDYYFSKSKYSKLASRNHNKLADSILPSTTPYFKRRQNVVAYRNFLKNVYPKLSGIDYRIGEDSLVEVNGNKKGTATVDSVEKEYLGNLRSRTFTPNLDDIANVLEGADSSINVRSKIPGILRNLMLVGKKYGKKKRKSKKRIGKNWQFTGKISLFRDNQFPYLFTSPLIPSIYLCPERPLNYVVPDDDQFGYRFSRYSPLHLAAPVETMKELITRISKGCDSAIISNSPVAGQMLNNGNQKQVYRIIPSLGLYNNGGFHNFGYFDNDDIEDEDTDYEGDEDDDVNDDYAAVIEHGKVKIIPLNYSLRPFSSSSKSQEHAFQPWNINSNDKFSDKNSKTVSGNDPTRHPSQANEFDSFWKVYSAPPKSLSNSNVIDRLSKIATGFEVNHGEVEFEPNEDYSDRLLRQLNQAPTQTVHASKAADSLKGQTKDFLSTVKEENIRDMVPWLNKYGVATFHYHIGENKPSSDLPPTYTPSSNVRMVGITDSDDVVKLDEDAVQRWYTADCESSQFAPAMLPVWNSRASDGTGSNLVDTNENIFYGDKTVDAIDENVEEEDDSVSEVGLRLDQENSYGGKHNVAAEIGRPKRHIMVRKLQPLWLKLYKLMNLYNRKDGSNQLFVAPYKRDSLDYLDLPLQELFHTLKGLIPFQSLRRVQIALESLPIDQRLAISLSPWSYKPKSKKKKTAKALLRQVWPEISQIPDVQAINELNLESKAWPIAYGVDNAKSLEMSIPAPASPITKDDKVVLPFTYPSTKYKARGTSSKGNKHLKSKQPHVFYLTPYGLSALTPIESYLQFINSPAYYRMFIEDDSLCQEEQGASNTDRKMVYPYEIDETVPVESVNIPFFYQNDVPGDPEITYRFIRKSVEDDTDEFGNGDVGEESLKPTILYRTNVNEEDGEKYNVEKIILKALASSRVARNPAEEDQKQETVMGVEERPVVGNLADVRSDEIDETVPGEGVNIPTFFDGLDQNRTPGDPQITYRIPRKFVEDDTDEFGNGDVGEESLKPTVLYRINVNEEDGEKYDVEKIILKALTSSRVARNSAEEDQRQETVTGVEERPVVANLADVSSVEDQFKSLTETYADTDGVSITADGNIGT